MGFPRTKFISFDVESSGELPEYALQPVRVLQGKSWITTFAYCYSDDGKRVRTEGKIRPTRDDLEAMLDFAIATNRKIVGWNVGFDIAWLMAYGLTEKVQQIKWFDAMLFWRHLEIRPGYLNEEGEYSEKQSFRLKDDAMPKFFPDQAGYEEDIDYHATDAESLDKLYTYNKKDVGFTLRIAEIVFNQLTPEQQKAAIIEAECLPMVAYASYLQGLTVDRSIVEKLDRTLLDTATTTLERLEELGATAKVLSSPKQLATLLFDTWGMTPLKMSKKTGAPSTDKESLYEIAFDDPRAKIVRDYREAVGNRKKFATTVIDSMNYWGEDITRPSAIVFGTYSGRMTYASAQGRNKDKRQTGFAIHQMKRGKEFRSIIKAPEGFVIGEFDAAGQEFRLMACASEDETMLALCQPGEDPHGFMGSKIGGVDYRELIEKVAQGDKKFKDFRQLGKVANLALQFRTSAPKLKSVARVQYQLPMELPEAKMIRQTYLETYRGVPKYWQKQIALGKQLGYVETFAGRRVQLGHRWTSENSWSLESTTINFRIQGSGADQKYLALAALKPFLQANGCYFYFELHDGLYVLIPEGKQLKLAEKIQSILNGLNYQKAWGWTPLCPLTWDCKLGKDWGSLKETKFA
jgi:DNA polymerase I-like protein with 3'-5' exonuclease and polymerase domains